MAIWKQALISLVIIVLAAIGWARYYPGANEQLARWGLDWVPFASASSPPGNSQAARGPGGPGGFGGQQQAVVTEPVRLATINDRLSAIGTGRAAQTVVVRPYSSGRIVEMLVRSGTSVEAGDVLARLDSDGEEIAVDRARITLADAEARLQRVESLRASNTVTQVQVTEAQLAVENARLQLRDAELALARRTVSAPIGGIVGILPVTAGNHVGAETEIATIDDRSEILVDFWAPERFAGMVDVGATITATSVARPGEIFAGVISAVDNRIDEQSRTLRIRALIDNPADTLRAGMSFQVAMRFPGDAYPAVDPLAVQWGSDGAYVWVVRDGRAERVPVRIVQRNSDSILVDASIGSGDTVVTEGIHAVREGAEVRIASRRNAPEPIMPGTGGVGRASGS